jgi:hypothetical protein
MGFKTLRSMRQRKDQTQGGQSGSTNHCDQVVMMPLLIAGLAARGIPALDAVSIPETFVPDVHDGVF